MTDLDSRVQRVKDTNTAYAIQRALEDYPGPNVLVCDPITRESLAVIFPVAEWDAIAKIHNETVDDLEELTDDYEALEEELELTLSANSNSLRWASHLTDQLLFDDTASIPKDDDAEFNNHLYSKVKTPDGDKWIDQYCPGGVWCGDFRFGKRDKDIKEDPVSPGVHNFMDYEPGVTGTFEAFMHTEEKFLPPTITTYNPYTAELKDLRARVSEQRKQISLLIEQATSKNNQIKYWETAAKSNRELLRHYGIKEPKIVQTAQDGSVKFKAVGGYL